MLRCWTDRAEWAGPSTWCRLNRSSRSSLKSALARCSTIAEHFRVGTATRGSAHARRTSTFRAASTNSTRISGRYRAAIRHTAQGPYAGSLEDGGRRNGSDTQDWRVNLKAGYTPNATDEYS